MQKKLTVLFAFAIFVLVVGMHTDSYACHKGGNDPKGCGGGDGGGEIPLCVTIRGDSVNKVTPDVSSQYCHGEEDEADPSGFYVIAHIANGTGNFVFNASNSDPQVRSIDLDFSDFAMVCDGDGDGFIDSDSDCANRDFGPDVNDTSFLFATRDFDIRSLAPGTGKTEPLDLFLRFNLVGDEDKITRQINFRDADGCPGNLVTVDRLTDGCWTVESMDDDEACLFKKTARGHNAPIELQGKYHMPFLLKLRTFTGFEGGIPTGLDTCEPPQSQ